MWQIRFYPHVNQSFRRKQPIFHLKMNHKNSFLLGFFIWVLGFPFDIFFNGNIEIPLISYRVVKLPVSESLRWNNFCASFPFPTPIHDEPYHVLDTLSLQWIRICSFFCDLPVREKVKISSINAHADFYADFYGNYSPSTDFLEFYSLSPQSFHAWLYTTKIIPFFFYSVYSGGPVNRLTTPVGWL